MSTVKSAFVQAHIHLYSNTEIGDDQRRQEATVVISSDEEEVEMEVDEEEVERRAGDTDHSYQDVSSGDGRWEWM